jgi:four helix bundle protein
MELRIENRESSKPERLQYVSSASQLEVFKRAFVVSLEIHKETLQFPKIEEYSLSNQLRRASKSICANLAEGFAKQKDSTAEFGRFISMAIGSCAEMEVWILYCEQLGYVDSDRCSKWQNEYDVILRMLRKLRQSL